MDDLGEVGVCLSAIDMQWRPLPAVIGGLNHGGAYWTGGAVISGNVTDALGEPADRMVFLLSRPSSPETLPQTLQGMVSKNGRYSFSVAAAGMPGHAAHIVLALDDERNALVYDRVAAP